MVISASGRVDNPIGTYQITVNREGDARHPIPAVFEPPPVGSGGPPPRIVAPETTALILESRVSPAGSTVRVPVKLHKAEGVSSLGFILNYDPEALQLTAVERGSRLTEDSFSYVIDTPGQVRFAIADTKGSSPSGTAAVVEFRVVGAEGIVSPLTLTDASMNHSIHGPLTAELVGADFRVGAKLRGDGNGDTLVTALDALLALKMASDLLPPDLSLDIDNDGEITIDDARSILTMARPS